MLRALKKIIMTKIFVHIQQRMRHPAIGGMLKSPIQGYLWPPKLGLLLITSDGPF